MRPTLSPWQPFAQRSRRSAARANSLIELLTVCAIIIFLLALLVPSLQTARLRTRQLLCVNNLNQWSRALTYYREDHHDYLPCEGTYQELDKDYNWFDVLPPYLGAPAYRDVERAGKLIREFPDFHVWICPLKNTSGAYVSTTAQNQFHYGMNQVLDGMGKAPHGSSVTPGFPDEGDDPIYARRFAREPFTVFMFDIYPNQPAGYQPQIGSRYHGNVANVVYVAGSVATFKAEEFMTDGDYFKGRPIWDHPRLYWGYRPPVPVD